MFSFWWIMQFIPFTKLKILILKSMLYIILKQFGIYFLRMSCEVNAAWSTRDATVNGSPVCSWRVYWKTHVLGSNIPLPISFLTIEWAVLFIMFFSVKRYLFHSSSRFHLSKFFQSGLAVFPHTMKPVSHSIFNMSLF